MAKFRKKASGWSGVLFQHGLSCFAAIALAGSAYAQTEPGAPPLLAPTSTMVLVPALVRSESGGLLTGLSANDFRVSDNGQVQKVRTDLVDAERVALAVVVQTGKRTPASFQSYQTLTRLVGTMFGTSIPQVALVTFDSRVEEIWNFPDRLDGLKYAFRKQEGGDDGAAVLDALDCAIGLLKARPAGLRRVILLLSQASDEGSRIHPDAVVERLCEGNVTVYSLAFQVHKPRHVRQRRKPSGEMQSPVPGEAGYAAAALHGIAAKLQADTAAESAELTGGERLWLNNADQLQSVLSTLRSDFANTYLLSFRPTSEQPGFHSIQVQLRKESSKAALAARQAYWRGSE